MLVSPNMSGSAPALPLVTVQVAVISTGHTEICESLVITCESLVRK